MKETYPDASSVLPLSATEEQIWLLQEQHPERILRTLDAWRVRSASTLPRLIDGLRQLIDNLPELNARYRFSDEGELIKSHSNNWLECLQWLDSSSPQDITEQLLIQQRAAWDAATQAPFKALLIRSEGQIYLALLAHRILGPHGTAALLANRLAAACAGNRVEKLPVEQASPLAQQHFTGPLSALRRTEAATWALSGPFSSVPCREQPELALRWQSRVQPGSSEPALPQFSLLFARFAAQLSDQPDVTLLIHHEGICCPVQVNANSTAQDLQLAVEQHSATGVSDQPVLHVHWLPAATHELDELLAEPLAVPTAEQRPELELSLQPWADGSLQLTLSTGQNLWGYTGHYLLGSFLTFAEAGGCNVATLAPSTAQHPAANAQPAMDVTQIILDEFRATLLEPELKADDDFFDFGGHSMLATLIIGKLRSQHGIELNFNDFFKAPTAATLATRAQVSQPAANHTLSSSGPIKAPFALAQASLGRAYEAFNFGTIFNLPFAVRFIDPVDESVFEQAFRDLIVRHASLRSTFHFENGQAWQQQIALEQLSAYKWFWNSSESQGATLASEAAWQFDLSRELPMRVRFLRDPHTGQQVLSMLVHHMAIDEWSLNVMMKELAQAYRARANDQAPQWAAAAPSFHEFATRQQDSGINQQHLAFWVNHLRHATRGLTLHRMEEDNAPQSEAVTTRAQWFEINLAPDVADALQSVARTQQSSLFSVLYSAIALSLQKMGDLADLAIGTSASGRTDPAFYETVGYFTTMVAHRVQFTAQQSVGQLIEQVTRTINDSMSYADVPMEHIQQALGMTPEDGLLFDVYVQIHANNALNGALHAADGSPIRYRHIDPEKSESMFGLQFEIMENQLDGQRQLRLVVTYRCDSYSEAQMEQLSRLLDKVIHRLIEPGAEQLSLAQITG
ncbi:condensation domain-containing protein [Ectopseudomonas mendocina]|uniref:Condensation domain-containing protein n=1 Tax=Ectopseudomonas mendocina TaxID=300 RepID=A0ABZ2RIW6_ECTME